MQIKVAVFDYYPMANSKCKLPTWRINSVCTMPGMGTELIKLVTDYLNWTIVPYTLPYSEYDENHEDIINGTYDMYAMTFEKTTLRAETFDFSDYLYESNSRLLVRRSDPTLNSMFDFFSVYNWQTWVFMGLALMFFIAIGALTRYVEFKLALRETTKVSEIAWRMLRLQLIQYQGIDYRLMAGSFSLLVFAFLQVTIIISLYQSWIISSVVRSRSPAPFYLEDLPRLLKDKKYSFVSDDIHEWYIEEIKNSSETPYHEFREAMDKDSFLVVENETEILRKVDSGNYIAVQQDDFHISFEVRHWCDVIHMNSPFHELKKYFLFKKHSPLIPSFNKAINAQRMMIEKIHRKYVNYREPSKCQQRTNMPKPLTITPYFGVIILFLIGMTFSCFVFGGELCSKLCQITKVYPVEKRFVEKRF